MAVKIQQLDPADFNKSTVSDTEAKLYLVSQKSERGVVASSDLIADPKKVSKKLSEILKNTNGASAIHFQPRNKEVVVRCRKLGQLVITDKLPKSTYSDLVNYLKIQAGLSLSCDFFQEAPFCLKSTSKTWQGWLSSLPQVHGEQLVLKLKPETPTKNLKKIGVWGQGLEQLRAALGQPIGSIFVVGPRPIDRLIPLQACLREVLDCQLKVGALTQAHLGLNNDICQLNDNQLGLSYSGKLEVLLSLDVDVFVIENLVDPKVAQRLMTAARRQLVIASLPIARAENIPNYLSKLGLDGHILANNPLTAIRSQVLNQLNPKTRVRYKPTQKQLGFIEKEHSLKKSRHWRQVKRQLECLSLDLQLTKPGVNPSLWRQKAKDNPASQVSPIIVHEVWSLSKIGKKQSLKDPKKWGLKRLGPSIAKDGLYKLLTGLIDFETWQKWNDERQKLDKLSSF